MRGRIHADKGGTVKHARLILMLCLLSFIAVTQTSVGAPPDVPPGQLAKAPEGSMVRCAQDQEANHGGNVPGCPKINISHDPNGGFGPKLTDEQREYVIRTGQVDPVVVSAYRKHQRQVKAARRGRHLNARIANHGLVTTCGNYVELSLLYSDAWRYFARGQNQTHCFTGVGVTWEDSFSVLYRYYPNTWVTLGTGYQSKANGGYLNAYSYYNCNHTQSILYRTDGQGCAHVNGYNYCFQAANSYGAASKSNYHTCPG